MKNRRRDLSPYVDGVKFLFVLALCGYLLIRGSNQLGYNWHWQSIPGYLFTMSEGRFQPGPLFDGLLVALEITLYSLICSAAIGLTTALLRLSGSSVGRWLAMIYLETIRNKSGTDHIFCCFFSKKRIVPFLVVKRGDPPLFCGDSWIPFV